MKKSLITSAVLQKSKMLHLCMLVLIVCLFSCKKTEDINPTSNNEFKATVTLSSGSVVEILAKGAKALMGCGMLGGGTYIDGINETNAAVYISVYDGTSCITIPGTYSFACQYRTNVTSQTTPIYESRLAGYPGTITFTAMDQSYMEGHFNSICLYNNDTVMVTGTFKGTK